MSPAKKKASKARPARARTAVPTNRRGRADEIRRERERRSLRNRLVAAGVILVAVGALVAFQVLRNPPPPITSATCETDSRHDGASRDHVDNPTFEVNPPAGGAHLAQAAQPSFYKEGQTIPPDGQIVHAMEHGFVVLWYKPDLGVEQMTALERLSDKHGRPLILVPRRSLGGEVAVTAWHRRMLCSEIDAAAISQFVERYTDKGPERGFI